MVKIVLFAFVLKTVLIWSISSAETVVVSHPLLNESLSRNDINQLVQTFGEHVKSCKREMRLIDSIWPSVYHFWREKIYLSSQQSGCALICLLTKFHLIDFEGNLISNAVVELTEKIDPWLNFESVHLPIVRKCEADVQLKGDVCVRMRDIANCLKDQEEKLALTFRAKFLSDELLPLLLE